MSQIPIGYWLMKIEGFEQTPLATGLFDDRWYTKPAPLFFTKRTLSMWMGSAIWKLLLYTIVIHL